jgi:uncharacterized OB-fold protein
VARAIVSAAATRPIWEQNALRIEGPDEDAFTVGLAALELLRPEIRSRGPQELRRLHLVGSFPAESDWGFGEALGVPELEVRRHPGGADGLWSSFAVAAHSDAPAGREAVVAAELSARGAPGHGAAAVGFLFGEAAGLRFLRHGFRVPAPQHQPTDAALVAGWVDATGVPPGGSRGDVLVVTDEETERIVQTWEARAPGITVGTSRGEFPGLGYAPTVSNAFALFELVTRLRQGGVGMVAELRSGRTAYAGFRLDAPVRWRGIWGDPGPGRPVPSPGFGPAGDVAVDSVSQGAYVPLPTYLENLASRWRFIGQRCGRCHTVTFPARGMCQRCGEREALSAEALPREGGEVEATTTIHPGAQPTEFDWQVERSGPYDVALVRLAPGVRATLQVIDAAPGTAEIGQRVRTVLRRLYPMEGGWRYGLKAILLEREPPPEGSTARSTKSASRRRSPPPASPTVSRATTRRSSARARSGRRRA